MNIIAKLIRSKSTRVYNSTVVTGTGQQNNNTISIVYYNLLKILYTTQELTVCSVSTHFCEQTSSFSLAHQVRQWHAILLDDTGCPYLAWVAKQGESVYLK